MLHWRTHPVKAGHYHRRGGKLQKNGHSGSGPGRANELEQLGELVTRSRLPAASQFRGHEAPELARRVPMDGTQESLEFRDQLLPLVEAGIPAEGFHGSSQ